MYEWISCRHDRWVVVCIKSVYVMAMNDVYAMIRSSEKEWYSKERAHNKKLQIVSSIVIQGKGTAELNTMAVGISPSVLTTVYMHLIVVSIMFMYTTQLLLQLHIQPVLVDYRFLMDEKPMPFLPDRRNPAFP